MFVLVICGSRVAPNLLFICIDSLYFLKARNMFPVLDKIWKSEHNIAAASIIMTIIINVIKALLNNSSNMRNFPRVVGLCKADLFFFLLVFNSHGLNRCMLNMFSSWSVFQSFSILQRAELAASWLSLETQAWGQGERDGGGEEKGKRGCCLLTETAGRRIEGPWYLGFQSKQKKKKERERETNKNKKKSKKN